MHMQHLFHAGFFLLSAMEQDALPPSPASSSSDLGPGLSPASSVSPRYLPFRTGRPRVAPWDLTPPGAMSAAAASRFVETGERFYLDCLPADFPVHVVQPINFSDEDESSSDDDPAPPRGTGTAEQREEAVAAVLQCSSITNFDENHVYVQPPSDSDNDEDGADPDARRVRPRLGASPGSLSSSSSPHGPRFPNRLMVIPQQAVLEAVQQDVCTALNEEMDQGISRSQIPRHDTPRHNMRILAGQLISPNDHHEDFLPSRSGVQAAATVDAVANVVSYLRTALSRQGLGHDRHRSIYNNANDSVRNMQEAVTEAAHIFHPRDAIAAARASLLALDTVFRRALHPPKPDRFGNIRGRSPFLLAIASVKLFDPILLAVRDNRIIYLGDRMALDLLDADRKFWHQQWVKPGNGPWNVLPPDSWDPRITLPPMPLHPNEPRPVFRPPGQGMLSPTDFDIFETATMYPIQLTASGSMSLRTTTLWVSKILARVFPTPIAQLVDSYLGHQQPFRGLLSSARAWVKSRRPDWLTCTRKLTPLPDMDTLEPGLDNTFEGHFFNVYMRRGLQMKYQLQALTRERAEYNRVNYPNAPGIFTWPDAEAVAQGHRNPELSHVMAIARMRLSPTHTANGRNLDAEMAELRPFNFSRSSADINGDLLFNPRLPSPPPQLFDERTRFQLTCMNCFHTFSAGSSCYQCNVCVNFVFCTECYQDQEDIHVRRHRRAHAMTHFVLGT